MSKILLTVSSPPSVRWGRTVRGMQWETFCALLPALCMALYWYGFAAARVVALSCLTAVAAEIAAQRVMRREVTVDDGSALLTGLLLGFLLPVTIPWWLVMIASSVAIILGKQVFGGLGGNPLNPALVGWAACRISWPARMNVDLSVLDVPLRSPLFDLKYLGAQAAAAWNWQDLLFGAQLGGFGAVQVLPLLVGGLWLVARGILKPYIPFSFLLGTFACAAIFYLADPLNSPAPMFHLLAGSVVFAAFFLAPDWGSSPTGMWAMIGYGLMGGALVVIIRVWGIYTDGVPFAVLLANLSSPLWDRLRPRAFAKGAANA